MPTVELRIIPSLSSETRENIVFNTDNIISVERIPAKRTEHVVIHLKGGVKIEREFFVVEQILFLDGSIKGETLLPGGDWYFTMFF